MNTDYLHKTTRTIEIDGNRTVITETLVTASIQGLNWDSDVTTYDRKGQKIDQHVTPNKNINRIIEDLREELLYAMRRDVESEFMIVWGEEYPDD